MLFNSLEFAVFFPVVVVLYFSLPPRLRTPLLLVASCVFYMWFIPIYILILSVTTVVDYTAGLLLEQTTGRRRTWVMIASVSVTCLVLFLFKYFYFFTNSMVGLAGFLGIRLVGPSIHIILPIGLSFHTFQSLSYVFEVYRGRQRSERNFITYATYVMFFPQLVAGPIERPENLLRQFYQRHYFDIERVKSGLKRMSWGFFKKLVVADRLSLYVNDVYATPSQHNGLHLTIATIFFAYQIYCDFSGYSDIAIGSARILGFDLMENFNTPYRSHSVGEFWKRWHISLSSWFRDYVYIPLGGSRASKVRWCFNIFVTFALSGLWHGASWTFVFWGALNGLYLILGQLTASLRSRLFTMIGIAAGSLLRRISMLSTTFILTCIAWVFFRSRSFAEATYVLSHFFRDWSFEALSTQHFLRRYFPIAVLAIIILECGQFLASRGWHTTLFARIPTPFRMVMYSSFVIAVFMFGVYQRQPFIYFQF